MTLFSLFKKAMFGPKQSEIERDAIKQFGLTYDVNKAGYILADGEMLDLSEGGYSRTADHRQVEGIIHKHFPDKEFEYRTDAMKLFQRETGAIRISFHGDFFLVDLEVPPTRPQIRQILRVIKDYNPEILGISNPGRSDYVELEFPMLSEIHQALGIR